MSTSFPLFRLAEHASISSHSDVNGHVNKSFPTDIFNEKAHYSNYPPLLLYLVAWNERKGLKTCFLKNNHFLYKVIGWATFFLLS